MAQVIKKLNFKKLTLIFVCLVIAALFVLFAYYVYPVPGGDSQFFLAPAIEFAKNGTLLSSLFPGEWELDTIIDPSGARRFLFNPPLYQLVLSFLMPVASVEGVFWALAFINIAVAILSVLLFYKVAARKGGLNWFKVFVIALGAGALVSSLAETGRPETLGRLWVTLAALVPFYISKKYDWIFYGLLLGLMFATHPAAGILAVLVLGIALGATLKFKDVVLKGSAILFIAFFAALGIIALGPFGVRETIEGTLGNAVAVSRSLSLSAHLWFTPANLFNYYITSQAAPFYGLVIILIFVAGVFFYIKYRSRLASPFVVLASAVVLGFIIGKLIYSAGHVFYISLFAPVIFSVFLCFFLERGIFWKSITALVFILVATGIVRTAILFPFFVKAGPLLHQARAHFEEMTENYESDEVLFGVTGGLWALSENYEKMYMYQWPEAPKAGTALIFFGQRYSGLLTPPVIPDCSLISDKFSPETPKLFGLNIANTMPAYGYAVYECNSEGRI